MTKIIRKSSELECIFVSLLPDRQVAFETADHRPQKTSLGLKRVASYVVRANKLGVTSVEWKRRLLVQNGAVIDAVCPSKVGSYAVPKLTIYQTHSGREVT